MPVFVEIFSGSGRLGRAAAHEGLQVLWWDISFGDAYDLTLGKNQNLLMGWLASGLIIGFHVALPCQTFSRIRDRGGGPPPLRSDAWPWGLPGLSAALQHKVTLANNLTRFACRLCREAILRRIPWPLENPRTSRLWLCNSIVALTRRKNVTTVYTDFCMWAGPFKKSTTFVSYLVDLSGLAARRCLGSRRACARTGEPHQQLVGKRQDGVFWTKVAEPYPAPLCSFIAKRFWDVIAARTAQNFDRFLCVA